MISIAGMHILHEGPGQSQALVATALGMITFGSSASFSIVGSEYMTVVGGSRAGTLTSWVDAPGYLLTTYFLKTYVL